MADELTIDTTELERQFERFLRYSKRETEAEFKSVCKGIVNEVFLIMPPAAGKIKGAKVAEADATNQARGEQRILRDMKAMFKPVEIKGRRLITHVFGKPMKTPVTVPTKERWPDVAGIWQSTMAGRKSNRRYSVPGTSRQKYWVDLNKFTALAERLLPRVGYAAAGFTAAARKLGARVPSYARRHSGQGDAELKLFADNDEKLYFYMLNSVNYVSWIPAVERLMQWAVTREARKLENQIPHMVRRAGIEAGLAAA